MNCFESVFKYTWFHRSPEAKTHTLIDLSLKTFLLFFSSFLWPSKAFRPGFFLVRYIYTKNFYATIYSFRRLITHLLCNCCTHKKKMDCICCKKKKKKLCWIKIKNAYSNSVHAVLWFAGKASKIDRPCMCKNLAGIHACTVLATMYSYWIQTLHAVLGRILLNVFGNTNSGIHNQDGYNTDTEIHLYKSIAIHIKSTFEK